MKHLLFTILFSLPTLIFSQNNSELMSASAGNIYYSTNKKYFITEYLTEPEHRYIFFYKSDSTEHHQVYFPNKNEIVGLFSTVVRSIENKKDIIYRSDLTEYTIINITSNISKVRVGNQIFSIDLSSTNDILKQFSQTKPVFHPKKNIKLVKANIQLKNQIKNK